jgi:hypothetical protein
MHARLTRSRLLAILLTSLLTWPVSAGGLYKVIEADGTIVFTDVPPPPDARIVTQIPTGATTSVAPAAGTPQYEINEADEADEVVARANARIDFAEHELAVTRQGLWSPQDGLSLASARMTPGDRARVTFYKNGVQIARQQLMDLLRERQAPMRLAAR